MKNSLNRRCLRRRWPRCGGPDVNLRGLGETGQLLVGRLHRDNAGRVRTEIVEPHHEAANGWNFMKPAQASSNMT